MIKPTKLITDLRLWAGVAERQGLQGSADLIRKSADTLERGELDDNLAYECIAYSAIAFGAGQNTFGQILADAAALLEASDAS